MAVENAPEHERIWIEDIYQNIFCGASQGTRKQADGIVAALAQDVLRVPRAPADRMGLGAGLQPQRACGNGELVDINRDGGQPPAKDASCRGDAAGGAPEAVQGSTTGFGFRDTGAR